MNLRKDQRHTVYIIMRAELEKAKYDITLPILKSVLFNFSRGDSEYLMTQDLTELYGAIWKATRRLNKKTRLSILDNCIELTY
jgi:hypothetical protein